MNPETPPAGLWQAVAARTRQAIASGALRSLPTEQAFVQDAGIRFLVRVLGALEAKARATQDAEHGAPRNPFLPYDPELYVADASPTHVCLLNKFNVVDHHLLIVTRRFVDQEAPLDLADMQALRACMERCPALGFYNSGAAAGASQPHKHLQLVPLPLVSEGPAVPIEPALDPAAREGRLWISDRLPFRHRIARFDAGLPPPESILDAYREALDSLASGPAGGRCRPYNLLITERWMLVVPRREETWGAVSVNALGFAGTLLVRNAVQLEQVRAGGPMAVLCHAAYPRNED